MKTPEQIKAWLEAQPWYEQFKNNTLNSIANFCIDIEEDSKRTLSGERKDSTILNAFSWLRTNEGYLFWIKVDYMFRGWYYNDENPD